MDCKDVTTQAELDAALAETEPACLHIKSSAGVWLTVGEHGGHDIEASGSATVSASDSATVSASGSATVRAYGSATVRASGSATVHASGSATVSASGSATVSASGSATVRAYGSATVRASGSATVRASGSATVHASGSATVRAYGSATVRASGSATVSAYDSATVRASGSATVRASGSATVSASGSATVSASGSATVRAYGSATVRASGSATVHASGSATVRATRHVAVHLHDAQAAVTGGVIIDVSALDLEDTTTWIAHHGVEVVDGRAVLYKALGDDLTAGADYGMPTVYTAGTEVTAADWRDDHDCGGGLHLSPTPVHATDYRLDATRWMRCTAPVEELRPIVGGTAKAKVRTVRVEAEVDLHMRELAATP
jgi:hypothetical protein